MISFITQLDGGLEFVPITRLPSDELMNSIKKIAPNATVVIDKENSQLMLQGTKPDVEKIKKVITQSESVKPVEEEIYIHTFRQAYPYYVVQLLHEIYPEVKIAGYPAHPYQLAVRLRPDQKEKVLKLFEDVDGGIEIIPLKKPLQPEFTNLLSRVAPYAVIIPDSQRPQLFVYGPKVDIEKVKELIATSEAAAPVEDEVYIHTFKSAYPYYAVNVVSTVYPEVRLVGYPTANQLALRFRPELKEKIVKLLDDLDGDIVIQPLKREISEDLLSAFPKVAPLATVIQNKRDSLVMIYGSKPDIEKIQKMLTAAESAEPFAEEVLVHNLKYVQSETVVPILKEIYPDLKIKDDAENGRLVIRLRPDQKEALASLLKQLDAADPDKEKRYFKAYPVETGFYPVRRGREDSTTNMPLNYIVELQKLAPRARIALDENSMQLIVWGTDEEHTAIGAAVKEFSNDGKDKRYGRFQLRRAEPYSILAIIRRMFPTVVPTYDYYGQSIIIEGHPRLMEKVAELIDTLDPKEPSANDPAVRFYTLNSEPTTILVRSLQQLVPTAYVVPDIEAKQIMVIAKPAEQKIIESNVKAIATFTAPEEPMLFVYPATPSQRGSLEAFIQTVSRDLKGVAIVPDKNPSQISVWAKPSEQQLIATVLKQMQDNKENEPQRLLKVFQMTIGDLTTAQEILKVSHSEVTAFPDKQGNRLLIWATATELEKVQKTLEAQAGLDDRQMLAYPVAGTRPETMVKVITDVFQGLKITPEPLSRRILVWASPEEHTKIAEIVEQTNKKEDPKSELAEKFVAYSAVNIDTRTILPLFKALVPEADVYADADADKITVRARAREHIQIAELLDQLRQKDEKMRSVLAVYPYGEADPVMIEAVLRSQLPNAESMTPENIVEQLGHWLSMERYPWYQSSSGRSVKKKTGYFKIDPQTQSVYVFVNGEDQKEVELAMKQIIAAGNQEGAKPVVKRYSLDSMSIYDAWQLLQQIAPSALIQPVFTFSPGQQSMRGIAGFYASRKDFIAYTRESEHTKIDALVKELNDRAGNGLREMLSVSIPDGSKYNREQLIEVIQGIYPDLNPLPGGDANQILIWAQKHTLEKIQQVVEQACKPLPEGQQTVLKTYPLQYISVANAKRWLKAVCPNASFDPPNPARVPAAPLPVLNEKTLYVLATPLEQIEIEKTLTELDKDTPATHKPVPRSYSLNDQPVAAFVPLRVSLIQAFPNATVVPGAEQQTVMIIATEDEHKQIAAFLKSYKDDREHNRPVLEVYAMKKLNYYKVYPLIYRIAPPPAIILTASKPEQIGVWATPREHLDISTALTRLETAANETETQNLRVYKTGNQKAAVAVQILTHQFPGAMVFAINTDEILAWASETDHEAMGKMLKTVSEAFPEPVLKTYYFKNISLPEGSLILNRLYYGRAVITSRPSTDDLLVQATAEIQEKIAADIAAFDVPRPEDTESLPVPYDLSELPVTQIYAVASLIRTAYPGQVIVLPSSIPGQIVVLAKVAEQKKIRGMLDTMLKERPEATSTLEIYTINRGTTAALQTTLAAIVPNIRYGMSVDLNKVPIWANPSDHLKIKNIVAKLNEPDKDIITETYSMKNVYTSSVYTLLTRLIQQQGLDIKYTVDSYTNQLIVQARAEDQKFVKNLIEKLRKEERDLGVFQLETVDPLTAYYAINTLFYDEPIATTPEVSPDQNTNMIFVQGSKEQLERTRKLLIQMGETQLQQQTPGTIGTGGTEPLPAGTESPAVPAGNSQLRVIRIKGDASDTIKELEKLWPQYQQNKLRVIRQDEPLIQKKEEGKTEGMFFMDDEVRNVNGGTSSAENSGTSPAANVADRLKTLVQEAVPNVYVIVNDDGSLTVTSHDAAALDRLEKLVKRIDDRVVFEGRDYTIYSVRNIDASLVSMKLELILQERLIPRQGTGYAARFQPPRLEIKPDKTTNTIYVRGAKAERTEVANLIAMLDVSELPGQISVTKPVKVPIKNTQAIRVWQQVMNVYQQKMAATRLPGGIFPRVMIDNVTNSLEVMAPEPLASEIKEYAEDLDRRTVEEPARKIHVIPLNIKSAVVQQAIQTIQQASGTAIPYGGVPAMPR
ncbi:MAG: hypothetical protein LBN39_05930 [Planctomycetaceae bacterium]|nr:hypothetical protein [Planctomycetaceae bacterium]